MEPVQGPNKELAAVQQEIDELEEELRIEKRRSTKLERQLEKCKSELESMAQTDVITQLHLKQVILLHQVKNPFSEKSEIQS